MIAVVVVVKVLAPEISAQPQVQLVLERMHPHAQYSSFNAVMDWANRAHMRISSVLELKSALSYGAFT